MADGADRRRPASGDESASPVESRQGQRSGARDSGPETRERDDLDLGSITFQEEAEPTASETGPPAVGDALGVTSPVPPPAAAAPEESALEVEPETISSAGTTARRV